METLTRVPFGRIYTSIKIHLSHTAPPTSCVGVNLNKNFFFQIHEVNWEYSVASGKTSAQVESVE